MSVNNIVEEVKKLTALELKELVESIEETFGVSAAAAMSAAPVAAASADGASSADKTEFKVILKDAGAQKIKTIKALRSVIDGLGLKEAKAFTDDAPCTIKENVNKEEAESIKKTLEEAGAVVELS